MENKVLIFGHKNPDTDTICSAMVKEILNKEIILDDNVKVERRPEDNKTNEKNDFYQISML